MATSFLRPGRRSLWLIAACLLGFTLVWASGVLSPRPSSTKLGEYHSTPIDDTELSYITHEGGVVLIVCVDFTVC